MKKTTVLFLLFAILSVCALGGCANGDTFMSASYVSDENAVEKVTVRVTDRVLDIDVSDDDRIHIDYFDGEKEYLTIEVSESKELTVTLNTDKSPLDYIGVKPPLEYRTIRIRLPDCLLTAFSASTSNAPIRMRALFLAEQIDLRTNGGNVECERIRTGKSIKLAAKNGNVIGTIVGDPDDFSIACRIKKGDCNLPLRKDGGEKSFTADCNNGDIRIEFIQSITYGNA